MSVPCSNHAETASVGACVNCGRTYCHECIRQVGPELACLPCAPVVAARQAQGPAVQQAPPGFGDYGPQGQPWAQSPQQVPYPVQQAPVARSPGNFLLGVLLASVIGIVGSILVLKFEFYAGVSLAFLYILVGYGIGWGMWALNGKGGAKSMVSIAIIYVVSVAIGNLSFAADELAKWHAAGQLLPGVTVFDVFIADIQNLGIMGWAIIAIGLFASLRADARRS